MANVKISALSAGTTPDRTEVLPAVQGAATVKFTVAQVLGAILDADIPATIARDAEVTTAVTNAVAALVNSAPSTLDTLNELATALGSDPSFATTMTTALAGKSTTGHGHAEADVTSLVSDLAAKAASVHTHAESDVTSLVSDLAGKSAVGHTHAGGGDTTLYDIGLVR